MGSGSSKGPKPTLYVCSMSPSCRAVLMACKAANIPVEVKVLDLLKDEHMTEDFIKINPDHTVPTIDDKGFKLWESRAVMAYLVDTYAPGHAIYPREPQKRAVVDRLLYTDISMISKNVQLFTMPQMRERKPADPEKAAEVEKALTYIENTLEDEEHGKFLNGTNQVTLADFSIMAALTMLQLLGWEFTRWPKVEKWTKAMKELPYFDEVNPLEEFQKKMQTMHSEE